MKDMTIASFFRMVLLFLVSRWMLVTAFVGGVIFWAVFMHSPGENATKQGSEAAKNHNSIAETLFDLPAFLFTILVYALAALALNWLIENILDERWYDKGGSAQEMGIVRDRVGTQAERPGDSLSVGVNTVARSIRIAVIFGSLFAMGH